MAVDISRAPFSVKYRELWLPRGINENASLPSSRYDGHGLAFTGARRGTTCDGVHFDGTATSNINLGAIHDNAATFYLSSRFKFDQSFSIAATTDQYIWGKFLDATHFLWLVFKAADGKLYFEGQDGGANDFSIAAQDGGVDIANWEAGRWYNVIASISVANDVRFIIDNGTVVTVVTAIALPNGGDLVFGDSDDPGAGTGFKGVIADFFCEEGVDLTPNQEEDYYRGIPIATVDNAYPLDEGRGTTAYDRGADGNNGTLDTTATWAWGRVKQPVISFDGINDHAIGAIGTDVSGAVTIIWVGKLKAIYDGVQDDHYLVEYFIDNNNNYTLYLNSITGDIRFLCVAAGTNAVADLNAFGIEIDDYAIFIGTVTAAGRIQLFANGRLHATDNGLAPIAAGGVITYVGAEDSPAYYDVSKPLMVALIEGVFDQVQALEYSRFLDKVFNLGVVT